MGCPSSGKNHCTASPVESEGDTPVDTPTLQEFAKKMTRLNSPLQDLNLEMTGLTDRLAGGDVAGISFEKVYRIIFRAITHKLGCEWFKLVKRAANRLVVVFRNDRAEYDQCVVVMRYVSAFAEATFCTEEMPEIDYRVKPAFEAVWTMWHSDKELRARTLWKVVRDARVKIAVLAWAIGAYEEVSLRPDNTGYLACRGRFELDALQQQQPSLKRSKRE